MIICQDDSFSLYPNYNDVYFSVCLPTRSGDSKHPPRKTSPPFTHCQEYPIRVSNYYPYSKLAYTQSQNVPYLTTTDTSQIPANCANQEDIFPPWVVISVLLSSEHLVQRTIVSWTSPFAADSPRCSRHDPHVVSVCQHSNIIFSI